MAREIVVTVEIDKMTKSGSLSYLGIHPIAKKTLSHVRSLPKKSSVRGWRKTTAELCQCTLKLCPSIKTLYYSEFDIKHFVKIEKIPANIEKSLDKVCVTILFGSRNTFCCYYKVGIGC